MSWRAVALLWIAALLAWVSRVAYHYAEWAGEVCVGASAFVSVTFLVLVTRPLLR